MTWIGSKAIKNKLINYIDVFIFNHSTLSVILVHNIVNILVIAGLYPLIPVLMCYPKGIIKISSFIGYSYNLQFMVGTFIILTLSTVILSILFKDIKNWNRLCLNKEADIEKIKKIRKKCISLPYVIYICQIFVLVITTILICLVGYFMIGVSLVIIYRLIGVVFCFSFFTAVTSYVFSKKIFVRILNETWIGLQIEGYRVDIKTKMLLQILPMLIATGILISLLGYSQVVDEKGNLLYESFRIQLIEKFDHKLNFNKAESLLKILSNIKLKNINSSYFIVSPEGNIKTSDKSIIPSFLRYFINHPEDGNRVYGDTKEMQGVLQKVKIGGQYWTAGVKFEVISKNTIKLYIAALIILLLLASYIIYCFSKSISDDITHVANNLIEIGKGLNHDTRKEIPIISNDEIGDLAAAFNILQQYESKNEEMKNEFFSNISHELRTPLNIILASAQLLDNLKVNNESRDIKDNIVRISQMIKQNSYRLLRLVNNLIDINKINASFYDIHIKNYNIINVVEDISLSVAKYIEERGIDFRFDTEIEEKILACDIDMIERIILNLLSNAVKFTSAGGNILVKIYENNNKIIISIKDNGIGIKPEDHEMIFERFKQVDKSFVRVTEGSGIGLYLVKLLVEMHGGTISVKSKLNKGSEFIITLPIRVINEQKDFNYMEKQMISDKEQSNINKVNIEFSDIYS